MCGIAGIWSVNDEPVSIRLRTQRMTNALAHRGPNSEGLWESTENQVAMGHRRLSIFDLSIAGSQPMQSADGQMTIVFNGEIYNFPVLKAELLARGVKFKSNTDTEVLLEMISRDGITRTLPRLEGMFAFALWDHAKHRLSLVRDAFGKKPLLYEFNKYELRFSSELKSFSSDRDVRQLSLNETSAYLMLSFGVVPEPMSILNGINKLPPGHILQIDRSNEGHLTQSLTEWFNPVKTLAHNIKNPLESFESLFRSAVSIRLAADVPIGAFLSGGIDSSLVAAEAQSLIHEPLKTFTIGFDSEAYDESIYAAEVARYLGTDHHLLMLAASEMDQACLSFSSWFDEPFGDPSAIPTRLLSAFAKEKVSVALTGDGGDEVFLGYQTHLKNTAILSVLDNLPNFILKGAASVFGRLPDKRAHWLSSALDCGNPQFFYLSQRMSGFVPDREKMTQVMSRLPSFNERRSNPEWLGDCDLRTYLVDDMLTKVDRASMSVGLELRNPLLDGRIVSFGRSIDLKHKIAAAEGKVILRKSLASRLPESIFKRKKAGFRTPIGVWLNRKGLLEWSFEHAKKFDNRFGWRTVKGMSAIELRHANIQQPYLYGRELWRVCQLMDWCKYNEM